MNQYSRTEKMIGKKKLDLIESKSVLIVGIGGVGGIALEMLVRCGIKNIVVVDFDKFEESNLNRQILCDINNIGKLKTEIAKEKILSINPDANITIINQKLTDDIEDILPKTDYIIDACDYVKAKIGLVKFAIKNKIKIISSCGTGNRLNPELLKITNIWKTEYDPLAKKIRSELRKEKINYKLPVVSSFEKPIMKSKEEIGSMAIVPNCAGILLSSYVINEILKEG